MRNLVKSLFKRFTLSGLLLLATLPVMADEEKAVVDDTVITSDRFEMLSQEGETEFLFEGNIKINGDDLAASCDEMRVLSDKVSDESSGVGEFGKINSIVMMGNVVIEQAGRTATSERAEIFPNERKVVLTENPRVVDADGVMTGYKMTLFNGEKRVLVESEPGGERPKLVLPMMPEFGFNEIRGSDESS